MAKTTTTLTHVQWLPSSPTFLLSSANFLLKLAGENIWPPLTTEAVKEERKCKEASGDLTQPTSFKCHLKGVPAKRKRPIKYRNKAVINPRVAGNSSNEWLDCSHESQQQCVSDWEWVSSINSNVATAVFQADTLAWIRNSLFYFLTRGDSWHNSQHNSQHWAVKWPRCCEAAFTQKIMDPL